MITHENIFEEIENLSKHISGEVHIRHSHIIHNLIPIIKKIQKCLYSPDKNGVLLKLGEVNICKTGILIKKNSINLKIIEKDQNEIIKILNHLKKHILEFINEINRHDVSYDARYMLDKNLEDNIKLKKEIKNLNNKSDINEVKINIHNYLENFIKTFIDLKIPENCPY